MNVKNEDFFEFFRRNVWWIQIKSLPLHHQNNINNKDNEKVHRKSNGGSHLRKTINGWS